MKPFAPNSSLFGGPLTLLETAICWIGISGIPYLAHAIHSIPFQIPFDIDEIVKRRVVQQWLAGEAHEKIIADNDIGAGTVSIIVDEYKVGLDNFDLDSFRELILEARKRGLTSSELASFFRLYNFFRNSVAKENEIESFIININSGYIPPGKAIELINQIYNILKSESVPPDQIPNYIKQKLEEKQKIDQEIQQADATLQSKKVTIELINEHIKLNEELEKHGLSAQDTDKLLNLLLNAREYQFDVKKIARKMRGIQRLEKKEKQLRGRCEIFTKQAAKYKNILPLVEDIAALQIGVEDLIAFKIAINEAVKHYDLSPLTSTLRLIDDIKKYNKIDGLKKELAALFLQKYTINELCSHQSQSLIALAKLKSQGITEGRILELNNLLENNEYKSSGYTSTT